jgi:hypothetical protein
MRSLFQALDQELALAAPLRRDAREVIGGIQHAIRSGLHHRHDRLHADPLDARQPQRVVARAVERAADAVQAGRQHDPRRRLAQLQRRAVGRDVGHHQQYREELVQEGDVSRDDHEPGDWRNPQIGYPSVVFRHREEGQGRDREVQAGPIELRRERRLQPAQLLIHGSQLRDDLRSGRALLQELRRRQRGRHVDRERRAVDVEGDLEAHRAEIALVDDDAAAADLVERQRA